MGAAEGTDRGGIQFVFYGDGVGDTTHQTEDRLGAQSEVRGWELQTSWLVEVIETWC